MQTYTVYAKSHTHYLGHMEAVARASRLDTEHRAETGRLIDNSVDKQAGRRHQSAALVGTAQLENYPSPFLPLHITKPNQTGSATRNEPDISQKWKWAGLVLWRDARLTQSYWSN